MYLTSDKITKAMTSASRVLNTVYRGDPSRLPISVDEVRDCIALLSGWTITADEVSYLQAQYLRGRLERFSGKIAKIHVRSDQDTFWKRLVATKELMHLIIDDDDDMCPYGDETLDILVLEGHIGILSTVPSKGQTELIAEIAAMEVLYPLNRRILDVDQIASGDLTISKIALKYEIPEGTASTLLNSRYLGLISAALADTNGSN